MEVSTNTQRQPKSSKMSSDRNSCIGISKKLKTQRFSMFQLFDEQGNLGLVFLDTHGQLCPKRLERSLVLPLTVQIGISGKRTKVWGEPFLGIVSWPWCKNLPAWVFLSLCRSVYASHISCNFDVWVVHKPSVSTTQK